MLTARSLLIAVLGAASLAACAKVPPATADTKTTAAAPANTGATPRPAAGSPDAKAIEAVRVLEPRAVVDHVGGAPIPGFRQVIVSGQVAYVSDDGRYMFVPGAGGALYDTTRKANLTEDALAQVRRGLIDKIPAADRITFAPAQPKYHVTVFTDISCGFCRKFHSEIAEYNRQGIAVDYVAFPRAGIGSDDYRAMVSVWCAPDRKQALTDAKNDRPVPARTCRTPIDAEYDAGRRAGLTGTPMILADDGTQLGGYLPPDKLREALDALAKRRAAG